VAIITSPSCDPYGDYVFTTEVVCSDISTCTPVVGPNLTISIDHSDICTVALADPNRLVKYNLLSYSDPTFSTPQSDFQVGDQTFWTFVVIDPLVSIDSVTLSSVSLSFEDGGGNTFSDTAFSLVNSSSAVLNVVNATAYSSYPPGTAITVSFELDLSRSVLQQTIGQLNPSVAAETLTLEVAVTIQYHGNQKKRAVGGMSLFNNGRASSVASFVVRPSIEVLSSAAAKPLPAKQPSIQQNSLAGLVNFNSDNSICIGSSFLSCVVLSFVWNILSVLGF